MVGSEGTLAIVTGATVKLIELPKAKMFAVGHFDSLLGAIDATHDALELRAVVGRDDRPDDPRALARQARVPLAGRPLEGDPEALLFVSFAGDTDAEVRDKLDRLRARVASATATATTSCAPRPRPSRTR